MSTKPDTETGWSKEYPSLAYGSWFWLRHTPDAEPELHQLTGGRTWMESFGIVRDTTEFLGPVTASDFEQLIQLRAWKESAMDLLSRYDSIAETFGGKLGSSKIDNLERGVRELRDDLLRLRKIAENALRFRIEQNGTCDHKEYMTALCTQCEIREALAHTGEQS